jgi:hypothetical protein
LCGERSCIVGNLAVGVCSNWIGILNENWGVDTKVDLRIMIAMFGASGMCG